jgi:hypothetical protein
MSKKIFLQESDVGEILVRIKHNFVNGNLNLIISNKREIHENTERV